MSKALRDWRRGEPISARRLQDGVDAIRDIQRKRPQTEKAEPLDQDGAEPTSDEIWRFVSKTTETERIEDVDDSDVYVDVERTTSVIVRKPNGTTVLIQLEDS